MSYSTEEAPRLHRPGKQSAAAQRAAERREREDRAPRLSDEVPDLQSLRFEIEERSGSMAVMQPKYIRRIVVANAPALFLVPCGDSNCHDGGHDFTRSIIQALRTHQSRFTGEEACQGSLGSGAPCNRVLHFDAFAEYKTGA
jgi:hypothetical protein